MTVTKLNNKTKKIFEDIEAGKNYDKITLAEYLEVSFLALMTGEETHVEQDIMYGGNVFSLHSCVNQVHCGESVDALRNEV